MAYISQFNKFRNSLYELKICKNVLKIDNSNNFHLHMIFVKNIQFIKHYIPIATHFTYYYLLLSI